MQTAFLKNTQKLLVLVSLFLISFFIMSCDNKLPESKYIGIQLWSVRADMDENPENTLKSLAEMGYGFIEAAGYSDGKFYGMEPESFRDLVESFGLDFLSSHVAHDIEDMDENEILQWWEECIDAHSRAGVKYLVQASMENKASEDQELLDRYIDMFNTVGEMCGEKGMRFGFHNHADEFEKLEGQVIYDRMIKNTHPDDVFFQLDLYWIEKGGADAIDYFNRFPNRFEIWHVKDHAELGASGEIDFERVFAESEKAGLKYIIIEVDNYNYTPLESVKKSLEFLMNEDYVKDYHQ